MPMAVRKTALRRLLLDLDEQNCFKEYLCR